LRSHRAFHARHGLEIEAGFINPMLRSLKVIFSNQKVKEKDREYAAAL
jgi:hypothetical protein